MPDAHVHAWKRVAHIDGCHFYQWACACTCGATLSTYNERSLDDDPYAMVWMDPDVKNEPCARCEELIAGAAPRHERNVQEPGDA